MEPPSDASRAPELSRRRFWFNVVGATIAIVLGCWLSSGTLAPYGTGPVGRCQYRVNGDHGQFRSVYYMLEGQPAPEWETSVVLRRIMHPLLAYPLMKRYGFNAGGLMFNFLIHAAAMIALALAIRRYFDARAAILVCWLFSTYPGYAYWGGLPYSYGWIVPGSIACTIGLLWWNDRPSLARAAGAAGIVGFVALGYDLMPCFGGALILMLVFRRRWLDLLIVLVVLGLTALFIARGLPAIFGFPASNSNNQVYGVIINSWLTFWERFDGWGSLLVGVPRVFGSNFLFSGMIFMPVLMVWLIVLRRRWQIRPLLGPVVQCVLLSTLALFVFLNAAPPYDDWQMRGTWISRLYQPWFVAILLVVAATSVALRAHARRYKLFLASVVAVIAIDALAIAGPILRFDTLYVAVHQNFYRDWSLAKNEEFFDQLGRRPFWFCKK
jgi:hypothetical protein